MSLVGAALAALFPSLLPLPAAPQTAAQVGQWGPLQDWGVVGKHMVQLHTGDVLVWSTGENARVWDPETGSFTLVPATFGDLHCAGHVTTADGRVIVLGGVNGDPHIGITITALFDPVAMRWSLGKPMNFARWYASVTALPDGRVLVTSGDDGTGERVLTPEIYDPATNTWVVLTNAVRDQSLYPLMYVLPDGRIYESGPKTSTAFLNILGTGGWSGGPANLYSTTGYSESSVMYAPGKILRAGGDDPAIARSAVIDMTAASPQWQNTDSLHFARRRLNLTLLADGKCLAVGGTGEADSESKAVLPCELWDPATKLWTVMASLSEPRMYHSTAILLPDGRVAAAGGEGAGRERAQLYSPPYLFKGARPVIGSAPGSAAYGSSFDVVTADAASITSVALLRPSAATHAWDQNQRYVPLSFTTGSGRLTVAAPAAAGVAPPGYYMLVIKNQDGVPSVARFVRIGASGDLAPGSIRGTVTSAGTLAPIGGATVATSERTTTTSGNGTYELTPISSGEHQVTFSAPGYATKILQVDVPGGSAATLNASLVAPGTVRGHVTDASNGQSVPAALVSCGGLSATADSTGAYDLPGIPAGSQSVTASGQGFISLQKSTTVPANGSVTLDFALVRNATYIAGGVVDIVSGEAIAGATVSYSGGTVNTDSLGVYRFDDVLAGTHRLTCSASGYASQTVDVIVTTGVGSFHDFGLVAVGSARIKDITFEGGSLTDPTTGADAVKGVVSLETIAPLHGDYSARVNAGSAYLQETFNLTDDLYVAMTLQVKGRPATGEARLLRIMNSGVTVGSLQLRSTGKLRLKSGSTIVGAESIALVVGKTYRLGLHQRRGTGSNAVLEAFLSEDGVPFNAPFAATGAGTWTDAANRIQVGGTTATVANVVFDDVLIDGAAMPGGGGPVAPRAAFSATPTTGTAPLAVTFTDDSSGSPTSWLWTFGDGTTSTQQNPAHTYTAGTYTVGLTVTNAGGSNSLSRTGLVVANAPPAGLVMQLPTPGTAGVPNTMVVTGAQPGSYVYFLSGQVQGSSLLARGNCGAGIPIAFADPYRILGSAKADNSGKATFVTTPPSTSAGKLFYLQAIEPATCKASNQVSEVF